MGIDFLKQLWDAFISNPEALPNDASNETCSSENAPNAAPNGTCSPENAPNTSGARPPASHYAVLPVFEHTQPSRKANIVTRMESGLGRPLSETERDSLLHKAKEDKLAESKKALKVYSDREKTKFSYTFPKTEGDQK